MAHRMQHEGSQSRFVTRFDARPWYAQTLYLKSRIYLAARNLVLVCSVLDVCCMMLDAAGYYGCASMCQENGGRFSSTSAPFRGHLGPSFRALRIAFGIFSDIVYLIYMAISFRTVTHFSSFLFLRSDPST